MPTPSGAFMSNRRQNQGNYIPGVTAGAAQNSNGTINGSAPRQYDPYTGQLVDPGGAFQGGTSAYRAGGANNGIVGSPNLGVTSALLNYGNSSPQARQYLQSLGINPTVNGFNAFDYAGLSTGVNQGAQYAQPSSFSSPEAYRTYMEGFMNAGRGEQLPVGVHRMDGQLVYNPTGGTNRASWVPWPGAAQYESGISGQGQQGIGLGAGLDAGRTQSPFELNLQNAIQNLVNNPRPYQNNVMGGRVPGSIQPQNAKSSLLNGGQVNLGTEEALMRSQARGGIGAAQRRAEENSRMDAARRGVASRGDASIRDQLNRIGARGASDQNRAQLDISKTISDLERANLLGGLGAGNSLLGTQLMDSRALQQLLVQLQAIQAQNGQNGLSMLLGTI